MESGYYLMGKTFIHRLGDPTMCRLADLLTDLWCTAALLTTWVDVQLCEQKNIADEPTHYGGMVPSEPLMHAHYIAHACNFVLLTSSLCELCRESWVQKVSAPRSRL